MSEDSKFCTSWCILVQFLPCDAMHKRSLCCHPLSVHPSVRPSVTLVHCIQTAEHIVKILCWPSSPIILVFWPPALVSNTNGNPFSRAQSTRGWENLAIFHGNCHLSRKQYEIGPWLLWNVNRKSYALYRMVTFSMTLMNPYPVSKVTAYLKSNISKMVRLRDRVSIEH